MDCIFTINEKNKEIERIMEYLTVKSWTQSRITIPVMPE